MPKLSVRPVIYKKNKDQHQEATIAIRVSYQGRSRYQETDYFCKIDQFDEQTGQVKDAHPNYRLANASIQKQRNKIERDLLIMKEDENFSIAAIEKYLQRGGRLSKSSFSGFVRNYIATCDKSPGTKRNYQKNLDKLHRFAGKENVMFAEIDAEFLTKYKAWLTRPDPGKRSNKPNTVWDSLTKFICKFFNESSTPLPDYNFPRPSEGGFEYLTLDELDRIESILPDLPTGEYMDAIHFLLECYAGIRHSDWKRFSLEKLITGENFKLLAHKNQSPVYLSLKNRPRLRAILDKILDCPYSGTLENTNLKLKVIAAKAGIVKNVSTHTGRHTCAVLHAELGYSVEYVSQLLGISLKACHVYYKITRKKLLDEEERIGKGL